LCRFDALRGHRRIASGGKGNVESSGTTAMESAGISRWIQPSPARPGKLLVKEFSADASAYSHELFWRGRHARPAYDGVTPHFVFLAVRWWWPLR
jgi:hypothetical protein